MPFIDRIIQFLQSQQGERIVIESDQNCVVYRPGGLAGGVQQRLNGAQIVNLVQEILPDEHKGKFAGKEPFLFHYPSAAGVMQVEVSQTDSTIRVSVGLPEAQTVAEPTAEGDGASASARPVAYSGPVRPVPNLGELFRLIYDREASDLHLNSRVKPAIRIQGNMRKLEQYEPVSPEHMLAVLHEIMPERNQAEFARDHDTDFSYEIPGVARYRCNAFYDRHGPGGSFRLIPSSVLTAEQLKLTKSMTDLCFLSKGLVLVTGPTGTGKSTTLAALVDHVNKHRRDHIITIEDPIEFVHENIGCLVNQREVHTHTTSFSRALRAALREDPDIVLVGEMRDLETVAIAIETAETGHLGFGTLHTSTASSTVDRVIDQFPADQQEQIRVMLSESLKAVIAQTLCRTVDGRRVAAFEVLLVDPACANLIREGKTFQLPSMMQIGKQRGCVTMNDSLLEHVQSGRVSPHEAYFKAIDKTGLLSLFAAEDVKHNIQVMGME